MLAGPKAPESSREGRVLSRGSCSKGTPGMTFQEKLLSVTLSAHFESARDSTCFVLKTECRSNKTHLQTGFGYPNFWFVAISGPEKENFKESDEWSTSFLLLCNKHCQTEQFKTIGLQRPLHCSILHFFLLRGLAPQPLTTVFHLI